MTKTIILGLLFVCVCVLPVFSQGNTVNLPSAAHSAGATAGYFTDPDTGKKVYRLSDRSLCAGGATHYYSYSNQFSIAGDVVFDCNYNATNTVAISFPVYDKNFKLLYANAVTAANAPKVTFRMVQWSQVRRVLFAQQGTRLWELDPFNGASRQIADFGGKTFTTSSGGTLTVGNVVALSVGPGDRLMVHVQPVGNYTVMAVGTFELATGRYSFVGVPVQGQFAPTGFDEAAYSQNPNGRVMFQNSYASAYTYASNLTSPVKYDDNNGHRGFFCGSNGRCYKVNVKNDTLSNGAVAQLGCAAISPWIPEHALYNDATGRRELVWSCDMLSGSNLRKAMGHFSRSLAPDVFFGSGSNAPTIDWIARYQVTHDASGNPNKVTGALVATARSNSQACGYWAQPRATSDPTGTRALFDSSANNTTYISKENGVVKTSCTADVYVAEYSAPPPASTVTATPGSLAFTTSVGSNPPAQSVQISTSSSSQSWTAASNQSWLKLGVASGSGSVALSVWASTSGLLAGSYSGTVTITAGSAQATVAATLTIAGGSSVASLSMSPNPVIGPGSATGTVTLGAAAPSGGAVVALSKSSSVVSAPSSVTVPAGQTKTTFTASAAQVQQRTQVTIAANYNGAVQAVMIVDPPATSLTLSTSPTSVAFSGTAAGSNPPAQNVQITTSSSTQAWTASPNQSWLKVGAGAGTGSATLGVSVNTSGLAPGSYTGTITVTSGAVQANLTANLTLGAGNKVTSISFSPNPVIGPATSTARVTLGAAAPSGGAKVGISRSSSVATVPASITIPAGQTSGTFQFSVAQVSQRTQVTIAANYNGAVQAVMIVDPPATSLPSLIMLYTSPSTQKGGLNATGNVQLSSAAPSGGVSVSITSDKSSVIVPSNVLIPAGSTTASFVVSTTAVTAQQIATVKATYNGRTVQTSQTVVP